MQRFSVASMLLLLTVARTMAETNKQMRKYVESYVPAEYEKVALREQNLSKAHGNGALHGSGSSIELLEQAPKDHQSHNKQNISKAEKKQMMNYVEEYAPAKYRKEALREEGLSKGSNHGNSDSIELLEQAPQDQSHNKQNTSKGEKKQMKKYVDEYVPAEYQKKAMREEGLSKNSNHRSSEGGAIDGSGSSIELLEQAQQDHQSHNKQNTSKAEKKQMRTYVDEYVPEEYQKKAMREEGLSKGTGDNHKEVKDGKVQTVNRATFLSGNLQVFSSFNSASLVFAAFMGATLFLLPVVFKKRRAYQAVNFPESTLG
jgi:hypothetical protein